jgi:hypothetical protein
MPPDRRGGWAEGWFTNGLLKNGKTPRKIVLHAACTINEIFDKPFIAKLPGSGAMV